MTSECPSDCVRVCAHHCGVWKQQSGGSTHSRCQPCENRKCPRDYIEPGENTSLERLKATLKYLIITHRDISNVPGRNIPFQVSVQPVYKRSDSQHPPSPTWQIKDTNTKALSAGGLTTVLNTNGQKLKHRTKSRCRKHNRKPCTDPNMHEPHIVWWLLISMFMKLF